MAILLDQRSSKLNKVKEQNIQSIGREELFHFLRRHQHSSGKNKILKDQNAKTTGRVASITSGLWLPLSIERVLYLKELGGVLYHQSGDSRYLTL